VRSGQKARVGLERLAQPKAEIEETGPRRRRCTCALAVVTARSALPVAWHLPMAKRPRCSDAGGESLRAGQGMW
jgi:hypothetical protein